MDGPAAPSLGIPQGSDPAFILARSAVIGASGKKTKARCHCGRGLGFLTLFTLRLLGLVAGRLLKICVEFPSFSLETNKKARSTFPFPARPLRFPGSCPFLPLHKNTLRGEFGKGFILFGLIGPLVRTRGQVVLLTWRSGVGLPAWRGLWRPMPGALRHLRGPSGPPALPLPALPSVAP